MIDWRAGRACVGLSWNENLVRCLCFSRLEEIVVFSFCRASIEHEPILVWLFGMWPIALPRQFTRMNFSCPINNCQNHGSNVRQANNVIHLLGLNQINEYLQLQRHNTIADLSKFTIHEVRFALRYFH